MELREPTEENHPEEPQNSLGQPIFLENRGFRPNSKEFGPPKIHTVIENDHPLQLDNEHQDEPDLQESFHGEPIAHSEPPHFVAPPPRYAREGRTSFQANLNPDAEVIPTYPEGPNAVHRIVLN